MEQPAIPLAVDDKKPKAKNLKRPDVVAGFVRHENLDLPTTDSASTADSGPSSGGRDLPKSSGHLESIERCDMFSATEAVHKLNVEGQSHNAMGSRRSVRLVFGRNGDCVVRIGGNDLASPKIFVGSEFVQYAMNSDVKTERLEAVAAAHAEPANRGPYVGKYRGFGVIGDDEVFKQRVATWLCGGYLVEGSFEPSKEVKHIDDADLWALTEPTIRRVCGRPDEPMTPPLGWDLLRVDYTQLLMEDWKIGTDSQLKSPPEKKGYLRAGPGATRMLWMA